MKHTNEIYHKQLKKAGNILFPISAGIFFGYNLGLIAGDSILNIDNYASKCSVYGALTGCLLVLLSGNFRTRKEILLISAVISLITSFLGTFVFSIKPSSEYLLYSIRFFMGITAGLSCVAPVHLVEECSPSGRGNYFASYQLSITVGILLAFILIRLLFIFGIATTTESTSYYYSATFFVSAFLSLLSLLAISYMDAPSFKKWTKKHMDFDQIRKDINKFLEKEKNKDTIEDIKNSLKEPSIIQKNPWYKVYRYPIIIAILIMVVQQVVGINIILFRLPELLDLFGINETGKLFFLLIIGIINVLSTIPGMLLIDRIGRRYLFLLGMSGIIFSLSILTILVVCIEPSYEVIPERFHVSNQASINKTNLRLPDPCEISPTIFCLIDTVYHKDSIPNYEKKYRKDFKNEFITHKKDMCVHVKTVKGGDVYNAIGDSINCKISNFEDDAITYILTFERGVLKEVNGIPFVRFNPLFEKAQRSGLLIFISLVVIYVIFFASSLGILGWLVPAEILPIKMRSQGMAIVGSVHWLINLLIVSTFHIRYVSSFFIVFFILTLIAIVFGFYYFPETKGRSLKYIDYFWRSGEKFEEINNETIFEAKAKEVEYENKKYMNSIRRDWYEKQNKK